MEKRNRRIDVRVTEGERRSIAARARRSGETISTYVFNATIRGNAHTAQTLSSFWALTTIIFVIILIVVISANLAGRRRKEAVK